jgi:glycosyltransferase involved in cell wall biosynthesis
VPPISVTIITFNEAAHIAAAIDSVAWADEIVVVDSGSTDGTPDLARERAARVEIRDWPGYAAQKNHAASLAAHDWVLSLDADERVGVQLTASLQAWRRDAPDATGYRMARVTQYLGRWLRTTDWYPDRQLRLYDRRRARWKPSRVHESVAADGAVGQLRGELLHHPYETVGDHLQRIDRYTSLAALDMRDAGRRAGALDLLAHPPLAFARNYVLKRGVLDGRVGLAVSLLNSYYVLLKYVKLLELEVAASRPRARLD